MRHALHDLVTVFDVSAVVVHPRVENIPQTVLPEVFHRQDTVHLRVPVLRVSPKRSQLRDRLETVLEGSEGR